MLGEDVEYHRGAIHHLDLGGILQRTPLAGRQIIVDDDGVSLVHGDDVGQLAGLARTHVCGGVGLVPMLQQTIAHHRSGGLGQCGELAKRLLGLSRGGGHAGPHAHQHHTLKADLAVFDFGDVLQLPETRDMLELVAGFALLPLLGVPLPDVPIAVLVQQDVRLVGQHTGQHRLFLFARLTGLIRINGILLAQWHLCCHSCSLLVIRHSVSVTRHLSLGIRHETPLQA